MLATVKKYGKYVLIILIGIILIAFWIAFQSWRKKADPDAGVTEGTERLKDVTNEIGAQLTEANQQATVEVAAARASEDKTKTKLKEVIKIKNKVERRNKLSALYSEVQG